MAVSVPSGDQTTAREVWLPKVSSARYLRDYAQVVLSDGLAGLGPLLQSRLGDPQGALLGVHDERGWLEPILFDPTLGPPRPQRRGRTAVPLDRCGRTPGVGQISVSQARPVDDIGRRRPMCRG